MTRKGWQAVALLLWRDTWGSLKSGTRNKKTSRSHLPYSKIPRSHWNSSNFSAEAFFLENAEKGVCDGRQYIQWRSKLVLPSILDQAKVSIASVARVDGCWRAGRTSGLARTWSKRWRVSENNGEFLRKPHRQKLDLWRCRKRPKKALKIVTRKVLSPPSSGRCQAEEK